MSAALANLLKHGHQFPMSLPTGGLIAKRSELAGQVEQCRRDVQRLAEKLTHLDATIHLFDPDYAIGAVHPKRPHHRQQWFASFECQRLILEALRDAPEHPAARACAQKTVQAVLRRLAAKGAARVVALDGQPQVWTRA